jgi:hypothetical protein
LHPALETLLHLLNADLASAHFLVRHMQSPPAWEGMAMHALLHRFEGDLDNARAWYSDIAGCSLLEFLWAKDGTVGEVRDAERLRETARGLVEADEQFKKSVGRADKQAEAKHSAQNMADDADASAPGTSAAQKASTGLPKVKTFMDRVEAVQRVRHAPRKFGRGEEAWETEVRELSEVSEVECRRLLAWCEARFGMERLVDATGEYVGMSEKVKEIAQKQTMGGEGWRDF